MKEQSEARLGNVFQEDWKTEWPVADVLQEGMEYALTSGGKQLRPLLCLQLTDALGGDPEVAKLYARAIESHHNLTLVHDDIMDEDVKRRGKDAVWKKYGVDYGVLIGDALYALGFSYLSDLSFHTHPRSFRRLLEVYTDMSLEMADGQAMDLQLRERDAVSREEYLQMARKKTGSLFSAALAGSAILAGADDEIHENLGDFAQAIGPAFQIRDDVIDLVGDKGRERPGQDIVEGKRSLVAVLALQRLEGDRSDELVQILNKPRADTTQADIDRAIDLFRSVQAITDANEISANLAAEAVEALDRIDLYDVSEIEELVEFTITRSY